MIYLDHNATTRVLPEVLEATLPALIGAPMVLVIDVPSMVTASFRW